MQWKVLLLLSLGLELLSGSCLWWVEGLAPQTLLYVLLHGAASLGMAWAGLGLLSSRKRGEPWRARLFLFVICAGVPFVGVLAVMLCLLLPPGRPASPPTDCRVIAVPPLEGSGEGQPGSRLGSEPVAELRHGRDAERRLSLLLATRRLGDACAVPLQAVALKDTSDEVRLLAYGFLEARERSLSARLQSLTEALARATPARRGPLHLERAQYGWELVYLGLAQGDLAAHLLREARTHAEEAMRLLPRRGAPCLLLARILLRLGEVEAAARALEETRRRGMAPGVVAPFAAEVAFRRRRFGEVRTALADVGPMAGMRPRLERLEASWR
jgi:hypothetical protein